MSMISSRGSLQPPNPEDPQHCFDLPTIDKKEVKGGTVQLNTSPQQALDLEKYVARSTSDLGIVPGNDARITKLLAYVEGSAITVTFYTQLVSDSWGRSASNSFSESLDSVHQKYRKINGFQMKLTDQVSYGYNAQETQSMVNGEAVLYPYFCPYQGDMFVYQASSTKLGLYKITEPPTRLSIEAETCHTIRFSLVTWLDDEMLAKLNACVVDEATFELTSYLNSKGAFLSSDAANLMNDTKKAIATLTHYYMSEFLERDIYRTFIEDACLYDPYIVEFNLKLFESSDFPIYPMQLVPNPKHWRESFWYMLLDPDYTPESIVIKTALRLHYGVTYRDVDVNPLINSCFIQLQDRDVYKGHPYPPFIWPTEFDEEQVTLPMQVRLYLDSRQVYPYALLKLAKEMLVVRRKAGFYYIPILIFLLKKLLAALLNGNADIIYAKEPEDNHDNGGCDENCDDCIFGCHPPHLRKVTRCPAHARLGCTFTRDCNTIYIPPCGGCASDNVSYPTLPDRCPPPCPPRFADIRKVPQQMNGWTTNAIPPQGIPPYGPKPPVPTGCPPVPPHVNPPPHCCPPPPRPPRPCPYPCPTPYDDGRPYIGPRASKIFVLNRPANKSGYLQLQIQMAPDAQFAASITVVDTSVNPDESISESIPRSVIRGFDGSRYTDLDENGIPDACPMTIVRLEYPVCYVKYHVRYQWVDASGYELGWVVLQ